MSNTQGQNYELAYHITANLDEAEVQKSREEIEKLVSSNGGKVSYAKDPEKTRLSYMIDHQQFSYFGYVQFTLDEKEGLEHIKEQMNLNGNVLRHLLMKVNPEVQKDTDAIRKIAMSDRKRPTRSRQPERPKATPQEEAVKAEEIEKKIDDIIEKI